MRSRVDDAAREARARRDDDARRGIRFATRSAPSFRAAFDGTERRRPTTGGFAATDGADDDEARDDERAMTDDERAIAIASQTGDVERGRRRGERSERKGAQAGGVELLEGAQGAFAR